MFHNNSSKVYAINSSGTLGGVGVWGCRVLDTTVRAVRGFLAMSLTSVATRLVFGPTLWSITGTEENVAEEEEGVTG
jgi:hypothetical protein